VSHTCHKRVIFFIGEYRHAGDLPSSPRRKGPKIVFHAKDVTTLGETLGARGRSRKSFAIPCIPFALTEAKRGGHGRLSAHLRCDLTGFASVRIQTITTTSKEDASNELIMGTFLIWSELSIPLFILNLVLVFHGFVCVSKVERVAIE
jgi:hypothetical protein